MMQGGRTPASALASARDSSESDGQCMTLCATRWPPSPCITGIGNFKARGQVRLSNVRILFLAQAPSPQHGQTFHSFDVPIRAITSVKFNQPIFGANHLAGRTHPANCLGTTQEIEWKCYFMEGGVGSFVPTFLRLMDSVAAETRHSQPPMQQQPPPMQQQPMQQQPPMMQQQQQSPMGFGLPSMPSPGGYERLPTQPPEYGMPPPPYASQPGPTYAQPPSYPQPSYQQPPAYAQGPSYAQPFHQSPGAVPSPYATQGNMPVATPLTAYVDPNDPGRILTVNHGDPAVATASPSMASAPPVPDPYR